METSSTTFLPIFGLGSMAQSAGLVEIAVRLCLNQRKQLCPHVWVPILKPLRPCIRSVPPKHVSSDVLRQVRATQSLAGYLDDLDDYDDDDVWAPVKNKHVVFADSTGRSLTDVRVFSDEEDHCDLDPLPSLQGLVVMTEAGYSCTVSTCCPGTQLTLGFPQPSANFQAFRAKLAENMVTLENCTVTEQALRGTVRVQNVSFQKDVRVRITFDSWQSYRDVPCTYLQQRFGGPQTDIFEFDIDIPKVLDAKRKIEFCLSYSPGGQSNTFWDNNNGQNYTIDVCVSSHLCHS
ncbi:protein phosphatase 1 regulatory subunit 3C-B-like [Phyllopteryx taeniolatus]|uniref:protein phosphatase 1 regulatory subunit 3C-B-like n=1 Tax=Phyllopteryx taeniolatus TaxID=161469 RepID=UPI002AD259D3|nr:protein phosphatase 1 regulatory subunit 3C-B-like [Phyllopteryx taeniolatus]XP_061624522.1 protein phosphatase 1 regulatory subunit 3C-B-like [Phyllopteryx taeniolatus]